MQDARPQYDVGVIVGRFQVHELHQAHKDLIQHVFDNHEKVIIFLGLSPLPVSFNNPLDFESRKQMILAEFPEAIVLYCKDTVSDEVWSRKLDEMIGDVLTPTQTVVLYGSRDSFISHYSGKFPTQELLQETFVSGSTTRREIARSRARATPEFRAGVIWASQSRFPTAYTTVDVAVLDGTREFKVLLGRKAHEKLFRFLGGFSDPNSETFEADARREVQEEAGVTITDPIYLGSRRVPDWRYRNEPDCIKTILFKADYLAGRPTPGDDIEEVRWFTIDTLKLTDIVPAHRPLMEMLMADLTNTK
jgi:bifunctional NMN adenylyltransferase/nudix hydrolase